MGYVRHFDSPSQFDASGQWRDAARDAGVRAGECRQRAARLAAHQPMQPDDVHRAHAALIDALIRAERASQRLAESRRTRILDPSAPNRRRLRPVPLLVTNIDADVLRRRASEVGVDALYMAYVSLGGTCEALDVDAFVHAGFDLPPHELGVLGHALWELVEL